MFRSYLHLSQHILVILEIWSFMPQTIRESLNTVKDILTVFSVLISIGSVVASAVAWVAVNVFYPEPMGIEVTKCLLTILVPITVSTIMLQAHKRKVEYLFLFILLKTYIQLMDGLQVSLASEENCR